MTLLAHSESALESIYASMPQSLHREARRRVDAVLGRVHRGEDHCMGAFSESELA